MAVPAKIFFIKFLLQGRTCNFFFQNFNTVQNVLFQNFKTEQDLLKLYMRLISSRDSSQHKRLISCMNFHFTISITGGFQLSNFVGTYGRLDSWKSR